MTVWLEGLARNARRALPADGPDLTRDAFSRTAGRPFRESQAPEVTSFLPGPVTVKPEVRPRWRPRRCRIARRRFSRSSIGRQGLGPIANARRVEVLLGSGTLVNDVGGALNSAAAASDGSASAPFPTQGRSRIVSIERSIMPHVERADQVLDAAAAVFAERGYHEASMRDVAARSATSLAGLYYYFESKAELLYRITDRAFDTILARLDRHAAGDAPRERLRGFILNHLEFFLAHAALTKVLARDAEWLAEEHQEKAAAKKRRYYVRCLEALRAVAGETATEEELRPYALALFGMLNWTYTWYQPERDGAPCELADRMTRLFLDGFAATCVTCPREEQHA